MTVLPGQFMNASLRSLDRGADICQVLAAAINSADAAMAVLHAVSLHEGHLIVGRENYDLAQFERIFVIGAGKASVPMLYAFYSLLGARISAGIAITKRGHAAYEHAPGIAHLSIIEASHPIPDQSNLEASARLTSLVEHVSRQHLVICLLSGGGSALMMQPSHGLSLADIQRTTQLLLSCGADIGEINAVRKHLDDLKGGGLARLLFPARVISLIISDVVGDHLDQVASGPLVADPTTFQDAWAVLVKYQLETQVPESIRSHLQAGLAGKIPETLKPGDPILERVTNIIVGDNRLALQAAQNAAMALGFHTQILTNSMQGEASQVGKSMLETVKAMLSSSPSTLRPACFIAGGETTVTLHGDGLGGRNQELALGAVPSLSAADPLVLVSLATDGGDGPTDAAGAVATHLTYRRGLEMSLDPQDYLADNNSYRYFEPLGDLIKTGSTLTNVNDLLLIFAL